MKRTFYQYIMFFINDDSRLGEIARTIVADKDFPPADSSAQIIYDYMEKSPLYRYFQLDCRQLKERYETI